MYVYIYMCVCVCVCVYIYIYIYFIDGTRFEQNFFSHRLYIPAKSSKQYKITM